MFPRKSQLFGYFPFPKNFFVPVWDFCKRIQSQLQTKTKVKEDDLLTQFFRKLKKGSMYAYTPEERRIQSTDVHKYVDVRAIVKKA